MVSDFFVIKPLFYEKVNFYFCPIFMSLCALQAQFSYGAGVSLIADGYTGFGAQGKVLYQVNDTWTGSGSFTYYFEDFTFFTVDLDAHYKLMTLGENIEFSPFAGLDIARVSIDAGVLGTVSDTDAGINIGASFRLPLNSLMLYLEPKKF